MAGENASMGDDMKSNFAAANTFVERGFAKKQAGRESVSGPGSSLVAAAQALDLIRATIINQNLKSVLDLGCGDWNWMQKADFPDFGEGLDVSYEGWDASERIVASLQQEFGMGKIKFKLKDITTSALPKVDLIIARDVLFHIDESITLRMLEEIKKSCRYFISSSWLGVDENTNIRPAPNIKGWGFYQINLNISPFKLAENLVQAIRESDCHYQGRHRFICLFEF